MDKNQKLSRPEPGKADTHVTLPHKQGNAETHAAPEKNG